jgi:hypothetical protein
VFTSNRKKSGCQDHISDEDVLLFADGELDGRRTAQIRRHFETCWECRTRLLDFQNTVANFVHFNQNLAEQAIPPIAGPLAQLKVRLRTPQVTFSPKPRREFSVRSFSSSVAAVFLVFLFIAFLLHSDSVVSTVSRYPSKPLPALTPGEIVPISRQQVCALHSIATPRVTAPALRKRVFQEYGMPNPQEQNFELDFLITPELGGAETIKNLWPEPYHNTVWNAHVKDQLEIRLKDLVCTGEVDLGTAQRELATDWVAAYQRYFKSETPIRGQAQVTLLLALVKQP